MKALLLWLRRGSGLVVFPTIGGFLLATSATTHPWLLDAGWGMRYGSAAVSLFSPLLAAAVAYDLARRVNPTLAEVARGGSRGSFATLLPMIATLLWGLAATVMSWAVIGIVVSHAGGVGPRDPWIYIETIAAYAAASAVGALVGSHVKGVTAAAVAAVVVMAAASVLGGSGIKVFQVVSSGGTMIGSERTPARAALAVAVNLSIAFLCIGAARLTNGVRPPSRLALGALVIPLVATLVIQVTLPIQDSEYRETREAQACVGSSPVVCGPARAANLMRGAQGDLAVARLKLQGSGLALPDRFVIERPDQPRGMGRSVAQLNYDPASVVGGHLQRDALVAAMATPQVCEALFHNSTAMAYLELIDKVSEWMVKALEPGQRTQAAPVQVRDAYTKLSTCPTPKAKAQ